MSKCKELQEVFGGQWILVSINKRPVWLGQSGLKVALVKGCWLAVGQHLSHKEAV